MFPDTYHSGFPCFALVFPRVFHFMIEYFPATDRVALSEFQPSLLPWGQRRETMSLTRDPREKRQLKFTLRGAGIEALTVHNT